MRTLNLGIEMDQGTDFNVTIQVNSESGPVDLTGYSFLGQMRSTTLTGSPVIAEFDFSISNQFSNKGQVVMSLPSAEVNGIVLSVADQLTKRRLTTPFVFDVKMKDTLGTITRIITGIIYVSPQATQETFP